MLWYKNSADYRKTILFLFKVLLKRLNKINCALNKTFLMLVVGYAVAIKTVAEGNKKTRQVSIT